MKSHASKSLPESIQGVLFDLDGTLLDTAPDLYAALVAQCAEEGVPPSPYAPVRQVALAELTGIEGPSLVRLLDQLCAANLVRRDEDPDDRRAKVISLTDEGRAVTAKIEQELLTLRADVLEGLSRQELEATLRVLGAFNAVAQSGTQPARPPANLRVKQAVKHRAKQPLKQSPKQSPITTRKTGVPRP